VTREPQHDMRPTRRGMLACTGAACIAGTLAACGSGGGTAAVATGTSGWSKSGASRAATGSAAGSSGGAGGSGGSALASTGEIPEGSGKIFDSAKVVVTQPTAGEYKAFSAVCTHMACVVDHISNGTIECPCHGSQYSIKDGSVVAGPAPSPLPGKSIKVSGGSIYLA
jgi:Rieske Fe-S protein